MLKDKNPLAKPRVDDCDSALDTERLKDTREESHVLIDGIHRRKVSHVQSIVDVYYSNTSAAS